MERARLTLGEWVARDAGAKVNLWLSVYPPGADGYHPIDTLFCRISLCDRVRTRLREEPGVSLALSGLDAAPAGRANLAWRAAEIFLEATGVRAGVDIELLKRIPAGAGLGGGSSDAAAVLNGLNQLSGNPLQTEELASLAGELGSDIPFFCLDQPLAFGSGRGDALDSAKGLEARPFLVAMPRAAVSTSAAYALLDRRPRAEADPPREPVERRAIGWKEVEALALNDFERVIYRQHPKIADLKNRIEATDPRISLLSGSGAAVFAVYDEEEKARSAERRLKEEKLDAEVVSATGPV